MAWVYIIRTRTGHYYIGSTSAIEGRLYRHRLGHTATTRRLKVESMVLKQEYKSLREARLVEHKLKKLKRKDYIEKIIKEGYIKIQP